MSKPLPEGTTITCPLCKRPQAKTTKQIEPGGKLLDGEWVSMGFDIKAMKPMNCHWCFTPFERAHPKSGTRQIHLKDEGWVPLSRLAPKKESPTQSKDAHLILPDKKLIL